MPSTMVKICMFVCFLVVVPKVLSLKCYNCAKNSLVECEKNQTVVDCPSSSLCSTLGYNISFGSMYSMQLYMKTCAGRTSNCSSLFNETGILKNQNCTFLKRCSTDYCNGVPPTPAMTSGTPISTTKGPTNSGPSSETSTKGSINSGSRFQSNLSVGVVGLLIFGLLNINCL